MAPPLAVAGKHTIYLLEKNTTVGLYCRLELGDSAESKFDWTGFDSLLLRHSGQRALRTVVCIGKRIRKIINSYLLGLAVNAQRRKCESKKTLH